MCLGGAVKKQILEIQDIVYMCDSGKAEVCFGWVPCCIVVLHNSVIVNYRANVSGKIVSLKGIDSSSREITLK